MGTQITNLLITKQTSIKELSGKTLAVDAYNMLYQFLTTIRQHDGTPLANSKGEITSHINGLFFRTINLMSQGLKLVFVFDGIVPELKDKERDRRKQLKIAAQKEYEKAVQDNDVDAMNKFAKRTSRLTQEMVVQAKKMLELMGLPVIEAGSEGEAQAAYMAKQGEVFAVVSQDADSLLFGAPKVIKNLTISGKRKSNGKLAYETIQPEIINLSDNLNNLGIDNSGLIVVAMLVGTDYNIGGIKGIGPKKALDLVKKHKENIDALFKEVEWDKYFDVPWQDVYYLIKNMKINKEYNIKFGKINKEKIIEMLVNEYDFSKERVESALKKITEDEKVQQKGLGDFF